MIEVTGLRKAFGTVQALDGVDLRVDRGTVLGLLGPNGAGKTSTVRVLSTLLKPDQGSARVAGFDVSTDPAQVRRRIGLAGQYAAVDPYLSGRQNLILAGRLSHLPPRQVRRRADELLEQFGLVEAANRGAKTYSGGMRRRLDLAAALVAEPLVVFLDEPTTGLDPAARNDLWTIVRNLVAAGTTVLLTTQYLEEADQLADRIAVIDHGRVVAEGTPAPPGWSSGCPPSRMRGWPPPPWPWWGRTARSRAWTRPSPPWCWPCRMVRPRSPRSCGGWTPRACRPVACPSRNRAWTRSSCP